MLNNSGVQLRRGTSSEPPPVSATLFAACAHMVDKAFVSRGDERDSFLLGIRWYITSRLEWTRGKPNLKTFFSR